MSGPARGGAIGTDGPAIGTDGSDRGSAVLRVGTRTSALARAQSGQVADALAAALGLPAVLVDVRTHGDASAAPLTAIGGTGVFVGALRDALLAGRVDVAVHSLKDLPVADPDGIDLAAVPRREDPRDALVAAGGLRLAELPPGARVGTGSPRRAAALSALGLQPVDIRGNVDSRLARVGADLDAVLVALAGLRRLGREAEASEVVDTEVLLPAPGQGALALETRTGDPLGRRVRAALDHPATRLAVAAERGVLAALGAGCSTPVGALATPVTEPSGPATTTRARPLPRRWSLTASLGALRHRVAADLDTPADAAALGARAARGLMPAGDPAPDLTTSPTPQIAGRP